MEKEDKHFSHNHPMCPSEVPGEDGIICSSCELELSGSAYKCTKSNCDFLIHKFCFELPQEKQHKSHPQHPLILFQSPSDESHGFFCDACGLPGFAFHYHCSTCQFDIDVQCASLLENVKREDQSTHFLCFIVFLSKRKNMTMFCDVCSGIISEDYWLYYCQECDYGTHLECATRKEAAEEPEEEEAAEEVQEEEEADEEYKDEDPDEEPREVEADEEEQEEEVVREK